MKPIPIARNKTANGLDGFLEKDQAHLQFYFLRLVLESVYEILDY